MDNIIYDIVIYGGTSAGIAAAVQAARTGKRPIVIEPSHRIGGMTTCGLGDTDIGIADSVGGLAKEFYQSIGRKYGLSKPVWMFEPKVALEVMEDWVRNHRIPVIYGECIDRQCGTEMIDGEIRMLRLVSGKIIQGRMFIDASYEGDLLAAANISYFVGREDNQSYGETQNGIRTETELPAGIDPFRIPGNPESGLLKRVNPDAGGAPGTGDRRLQAYNFRMCITDQAENRIPIQKPRDYDEEDYEILFRAIDAGQTSRFFKFRMLPNRKADANNDSGISTDYIGMNYDYVEADNTTRKRIFEAHKTYQQGLIWTIQNHPRVPKSIRDTHISWGLPADEFIDSENWPPQLYVREARRMISDYVITERSVLRESLQEDVVGLGSYAMDSHHIQYSIDAEGWVRTEGGFYEVLDEPYPISYRALVPRASECTNLLVPVCVSATHAAYGSVRMEPVFMILGQSVASAACLALDTQTTVQAVNYETLREKLLADGQILQLSATTMPASHAASTNAALPL